MLLVVDVGNTNITFGLYNKKELTGSFRLMTGTPRTSDEYGAAILEMLKYNKVEPKKVEGVIISSVVPNVMHSLTGAIERFLEIHPLIVGPGLKTGIHIITENPKEIGPDRIVDAVGAFEKYGGPVLVMDFGTATTYDLINEKGEFIAGITAPGIKISA